MSNPNPPLSGNDLIKACASRIGRVEGMRKNIEEWKQNVGRYNEAITKDEAVIADMKKAIADGKSFTPPGE